GPWAPYLASYLENQLADLVYQHYARNDMNVEPPLWYAEKHWRELYGDEMALHNMGGATGNRKFISPNGHCEVVYKANGQIETNPLNMGTYNKYDPQLHPWLPGIFDVLPYMILGNSPEDMFTTDRWQVAGGLAYRDLKVWIGSWFGQDWASQYVY